MNDRDPKVYLTRTDTVIGFVSQNRARLDEIKGRSTSKHYITALPSLKALKKHTRIPIPYRNLIRRSRRRSFILPNGNSYRVIRDEHHIELIKKLGWAYTTSANRSSESYDEIWARNVADVVIEPLSDTHFRPSIIYKIGRSAIKKKR